MTGPDYALDLAISHLHIPLIVDRLGLSLNKLGAGDTLFFVCFVSLCISYARNSSKGVKCLSGALITLIFSGILVQTLKHLIGRARPQMNLGDLFFIGPNLVKNGYESFPSGHAMSSFAVASFLSYFYPAVGIPFYGLSLMIALCGRVLFRYHFLSDVIMGSFLGIALGLLCAYRLKHWINKEKNSDDERSLPVEDSRRDLIMKPRALWPLRKEDVKNLCLISLLSGLVLFGGISKSAYWDRDESEYVLASKEMSRNHEWLIPTLKGKIFIEKPIFLYWMARISYRLFGINEFSSRFPSALFGIFTCLAVYFLGRSIWGEPEGFYSSLILATSFLFAGVFRLLMTDPFFVFFCSLSLLFYVQSELSLCYFSMGFAFLCKGPIALFPMGVYILYECLTASSFPRKRESSIIKIVIRHSLFSLIPISVAAPWFIYCFSVQKSAASSFFLYENVARFLQGNEGHGGPMTYYIPVLLLGFFPWSLFIITAFKRKIGSGAGLLFFIWALTLFVFFSICATKLPHYILPALPALALLMGKFWADQIAGSSVPLKVPLVTGIAVSFLLSLAPSALYFLRPQYSNFSIVLPFAVFSLLLVWSYLASRKNEWKKCLLTIASGSVVLFLAVSYWTLPWIDSRRVMKPTGLAVKDMVPQDAELFAYKVSEPSLFIYSDRLFPLMEDVPLNNILSEPKPAYVVVKKTDLDSSSVSAPYTILRSKEGFAENGGEMTLLLIRNKPNAEK